MEKLEKNWITNGVIDAEYKRYVMLAYLQKVAASFRESKLYPQFAELIEHHELLMQLQQSQDALQQVFPKRIGGIEPDGTIDYISLLPESKEMNQIRQIVESAIPAFEKVLNEGKSIYEFVEQHLSIEGVGVMPLYKREGYVMLHDAQAADVLVYRYALSRIQRSTATFSTLKTEFVCRERKTIEKTFERMKQGLIDRYSDLPNPAVFLVQTDFRFPLIETYLPVSKRLLMRRIYEAA